MKPVQITHDQWRILKDQLRKDYKPSVMLIRERTRAKLGFTPREYRAYSDRVPEGHEAFNRYEFDCVMLDFYDEAKYTFFMMKYGNFVDKVENARY